MSEDPHERQLTEIEKQIKELESSDDPLNSSPQKSVKKDEDDKPYYDEISYKEYEKLSDEEKKDYGI